jgi:hypothetical protein
MSLHSRILLLPTIGAALLIGGCSSSHNTSLTGNQATELGTEIEENIFENLGAAFGVGVEPAAATIKRTARAAVAIQPTCTGTTTQNCTIPSTTFDCLSSGTFKVSGTFTQTLNTTTDVDTVGITGIDLAPNICTADNLVVITGDPKVTLTGTGLLLDEVNNAIELPFTVTEVGTVSFTKGSANTDTTFPSSGTCDMNVIAKFQTASTSAPFVVTAAVSGTLCGKTIPAGETVTVGTFE